MDFFFRRRGKKSNSFLYLVKCVCYKSLINDFVVVFLFGTLKKACGELFC